jgi:O-antigen ligase
LSVRASIAQQGIDTGRAMSMASRLATGALLLLPGVLTVYLSFNAGGFFPNTQAFVAILLAAVLTAHICLATSPFAGFSRPLAIAVGGLALYAGWTLLSGLWSNAPGRALLEFDRALIYLLALFLFGTLPRSPARMRAMLWSLALAIVVVSVAGLTTRVLPDVWPISATIADNRLSYPLTYWNSLGVLCAIGIVLCFHFTSSRTEPRVVRVLGAGALPILSATLLFTFSRGAIAAGVVGLAAYIVIARPRALASGLIAAVPSTIAAVVAAYRADLLASLNPTTPAAVAQGHDVALTIALSAAAAVMLRSLLLVFDTRLSLDSVSQPLRRRLTTAVAGASVLLALVLGLALDAPSSLAHQYDRFVERRSVGDSADLRSRLTDPGNNGRLDHWDVALAGFGEAPLAGQGAGTYQTLWARERPHPLSVRDAHSLYVEVLDELGLVGLGLLTVVLLSLLFALLVRTRGANRAMYAALLCASLVWTLHAGVDWDWEMPAVTLWLFAIGGAALAASARSERLIGPPSLPARSLAAVACFGIAIVPGLVMVSEARLDESADAFARGDCARTITAADSARSVLGGRSQPYELIGFCRLRQGRPRQAVQELTRAVERDPENWEYRYGLAVARGAAGLDPRPQAQAALRLNPMDAEAKQVARLFRTRERHAWSRKARTLLRSASPFYLSDR